MEVNKIYNCNCLDLMTQMPDGFIDLTVTSPPYDNLRVYNGYEFDFEPIARELYRVTKKGGVVVWVVGDATVNGSETGTSFRQALYFKEVGFNLHDTMIYEKSNFSFPANNRYHQMFEYMFVLTKDNLQTFNPLVDRRNAWPGQKPHGEMRTANGEWQRVSSSYKTQHEGTADFGLRYNIWRFLTGGGHSTTDDIREHAAIYPEALARDHILSWSNENDLVYDPFMGSGTTAKAAHQLKRRWIGSEISAEYCELANKRLEPYLAQEQLF